MAIKARTVTVSIEINNTALAMTEIKGSVKAAIEDHLSVADPDAHVRTVSVNVIQRGKPRRKKAKAR